MAISALPWNKRYFGLLMDSMLGEDFEKGLANLKKIRGRAGR